MRIYRKPVAFALLAALATTGCMFRELDRQLRLDEQVVRFRGSVSLVEPGPGNLVVVLIRRPDGADPEIVDHFVRVRPGSFFFAVNAAGTYSIAAFHDRNGDLNYDLDEPVRPSDAATTFGVATGTTIEGIDILIHPDVRAEVDAPLDIAALQARSAGDQLKLTLGQITTVGERVDLDDARFGPESGAMGLWRPFDFTIEQRPGVYFIEAFDPDRIPVLFVHGVTGYPQEFATLIESLDRRRFQPWFYFYPSGASLASVSTHLSQIVTQLEARRGLTRLYVVAHSMGGLVSRDFVLDHHAQTGRDTVRLLVTLSTPWDGHAAAQKGVDRAPTVVPSWIDVAPDSAFLNQIFYAAEADRERLRLPDHVAYHLLFGFRRTDNSFGLSGDGVVTVASELRPEAQDEALSQFGFDVDHTGILRDPEAIAHLNAILAEAD